VAGIVLAALFAVVTLVFDADQVVAGTALNLIAVGTTGVGYRLCLQAGYAQSAAVFFEPVRMPWLPFAAFDQFGLFYALLVLGGMVHAMLRFTRFGVELSAMGEYPPAAQSAGIRVVARRAGCLFFGGATAGLAGAYLSIMFTHQFTQNMTAGRGFLALAMVIFGRWKPLGLLLGGLFFGYVYAVETFLEVSPLRGMPAPQLLQMSPYILTLIVLAGLMGRARAPAALGQPLDRE
jgi:general nucleoside transport system permease protein